MGEEEIAFEMVGDDYNKTKEQLDSVRARKTKFVCINDNMDEPSPELIQLLQDFYLSYFPTRSAFELPDNFRNRCAHACACTGGYLTMCSSLLLTLASGVSRYLHVDERRKGLQMQHNTKLALGACGVAIVLLLCWDAIKGRRGRSAEGGGRDACSAYTRPSRAEAPGRPNAGWLTSQRAA